MFNRKLKAELERLKAEVWLLERRLENTEQALLIVTEALKQYDSPANLRRSKVSR